MSDKKRTSIHLFTPRGEPVVAIEHLQARIDKLERDQERQRRVTKLRREFLENAKDQPAPVVH